jgi:hypothetical protein
MVQRLRAPRPPRIPGNLPAAEPRISVVESSSRRTEHSAEAADAERLGRSFEGQVIAGRHYGEDVDIAPSPAEILALAVASFADVPAPDLRLLTRKLKEPER